MIEDRAYQNEAIDGVRACVRAGKKRVLIVLPTGGGKTVVASKIIRGASDKGSRTLFLAHRRELIFQTSDKLRRFGVPHGLIMASARQALQLPTQVASVQTLARNRTLLPNVDVVFVDEAHHALAKSYEDILSWYPNAVVLGLTATPWRTNGEGLADVFDSHVLVRTPRELRDEGFLVPVGGWVYEALDTRGARVQGGDFVAKDLSAEATKPKVVGNIVEEWLAHAEGKRTVVFAVSIEASQLMAERFRQAGVAAEHIDGEMDERDRDAVVARLRSGQTVVVCNCNVLTEGFDCPELEVCVLARPTLSLVLYLQMVGRVLRPAPGKVQARIHDHAGCLQAHGHPYAERDYSPSHSVKVERDAVEKGAERVLRCKACGSVRTGWPCDACGYRPTPKEREVEEVEAARRRAIEEEAALAPERRKNALAEAFAHRSEEEKRRVYEGLVAKHGPGQAAHRYRFWSGGTAWPLDSWRKRGAA